MSPSHRFPTTRWSVVRAAGGTTSPGSRAALERLCATYWSPVHAFVRAVGAVGRRGVRPHAGVLHSGHREGRPRERQGHARTGPAPSRSSRAIAVSITGAGPSVVEDALRRLVAGRIRNRTSVLVRGWPERHANVTAAALGGVFVVGLVAQEMADSRQQKRAEPSERVPGVPEVALLDDPSEERLREVGRLVFRPPRPPDEGVHRRPGRRAQALERRARPRRRGAARSPHDAPASGREPMGGGHGPVSTPAFGGAGEWRVGGPRPRSAAALRP